VQDLDIGLNIDASIEDSADGVRLNTQVEQSSIAEEKSLARRIRSCGKPNWKARQS